MSTDNIGVKGAAKRSPSAQVLWSAREVYDAVKPSRVSGGEADWCAYGVSINTRTLCEGDVFVALKGDALDGHDYVVKAFEQGAVAAIVSKDVEGVPEGAALIFVEDTFKALEDLGQFSRKRTGSKVIGITGSVGKTGTKEMLAEAFASVGRTFASGESFNNHWGVPFSLSNVPEQNDFGIFEMGMNHAGEISALTAQVRPDIAIITNVGPVHIEFFENEAAIARAKAEIFEGVVEGGVAVLPRDSEHFDLLKDAARTCGVESIFSFGEHDNADAKLTKCLLASNGTRVEAEILGESVQYTLQMVGKHLAVNSLSVLLGIACAGGDVQAAAKRLEKMEQTERRGHREEIETAEAGNPITLIDDSFNASPVAMKAAFKVLAMVDPGRGGRRIAVLGDMLELGDRGPQLHGDLAMPIQAAGIDLVYTCGALMKNLHDKLAPELKGEHKKDSQELATIVPDVLIPGDVVLVKGSKGSKMDVVVEAMRTMPKAGDKTSKGMNNTDKQIGR